MAYIEPTPAELAEISLNMSDEEAKVLRTILAHYTWHEHDDPRAEVAQALFTRLALKQTRRQVDLERVERLFGMTDEAVDEG